MMKKILLISLSLLAICASNLALASSVSANNLLPVCNSGGVSSVDISGNVHRTDASGTDVCKDVNTEQDPTNTENPIIKIIKTAITIVSFVAGAAAVILIIISAIRFITSGGDSGKVAQARGALTYALVGIVIVVLAQTIVAFVLK